ncbi:MAG: thioesterase family protein [Alphaproteobacteria bacterium]|nr:thioesterase family protein [Alphaproteobacteria bacterium]
MTYMLDATLQLDRREADVFEGRTDQTYWNLIGPYGGWIATIMLKATMQDAAAGFEPLIISVDFMKAPGEGMIILRRQCDRAGRTASFWRVTLEMPDGTVCARAAITLAPHRETLEFSGRSMPDVPAALDVEPFDGSLLPIKWARCYETRVVKGVLGARNDDTHSLVWIRDADGRPLDHLSLTAITDSPLPRLFLATGRVSNISTISMTTYLHASVAELEEIASERILVDCESERAGGGFYDQHSKFYSPRGRLIATSHQMVWYDRAPE